MKTSLTGRSCVIFGRIICCDKEPPGNNATALANSFRLDAVRNSECNAPCENPQTHNADTPIQPHWDSLDSSGCCHAEFAGELP